VLFQTGVIERDLSLLKLSNSDEYLRAVVLSAAEQSASDSSLIDSIELFHLAGSYDKVVESVNRALGHSLASAGSGAGGTASSAGSERLKTSGAEVGLSGAFGGAEDLYGLAQRVYSVYEKDMGKRSKVSKGGWETLGTLLRLKQGMAEFAADRPDLALEVGKRFTVTVQGRSTLSTDHRPLSTVLTPQSSLHSPHSTVLTPQSSLHTSPCTLQGPQTRMTAWYQTQVNLLITDH
jgi:nuclear pore complex protein Nup93